MSLTKKQQELVNKMNALPICDPLDSESILARKQKRRELCDKLQTDPKFEEEYKKSIKNRLGDSSTDELYKPIEVGSNRTRGRKKRIRMNTLPDIHIANIESVTIYVGSNVADSEQLL